MDDTHCGAVGLQHLLCKVNSLVFESRFRSEVINIRWTIPYFDLLVELILRRQLIGLARDLRGVAFAYISYIFKIDIGNTPHKLVDDGFKQLGKRTERCVMLFVTVSYIAQQ